MAVPVIRRAAAFHDFFFRLAHVEKHSDQILATLEDGWDAKIVAAGLGYNKFQLLYEFEADKSQLLLTQTASEAVPKLIFNSLQVIMKEI